MNGAMPVYEFKLLWLPTSASEEYSFTNTLNEMSRKGEAAIVMVAGNYLITGKIIGFVSVEPQLVAPVLTGVPMAPDGTRRRS